MSLGKLSLLELTGTVHMDEKQQLFFVLTESCRAQNSESPCDQTILARMAFEWKHSFIAPGGFRTHSAPGYRITKYINPSEFTSADLEKYVENLNARKLYAITNNEPRPEDDGRYRIKVYIYCAPCACQVATALDICEHSDNKAFVDFCIRIDHRQKTSCSSSASRIEGLISVVGHLKEEETVGYLMSNWGVKRMKWIDREWLEQQIYDYTEEDRLATPLPANQLTRIAKSHGEEHSCAAIVLLGEADYCVPLMEAPPFRPFESGRLPRETQLFKYQLKYSTLGDLYWERKYLGTYSPRAPFPPRRPAPAGSDTTETLESAQRGFNRPRSATEDQEGS